jgi:exopolysaccharide biosynthesis polyprenyl glycosylphosphotransferase
MASVEPRGGRKDRATGPRLARKTRSATAYEKRHEIEIPPTIVFDGRMKARSFAGMLQTAATPVPATVESLPKRHASGGAGTARSNGENPRLRVQRAGHQTKKRHFRRALRRVVSLAAIDLLTLLAAHDLVHYLRRIGAPGDEILSLLFPAGFMDGWGSLAAIFVGLAVAGGYASEERWARVGTIHRGVALGAALGMWQSIDQLGALWTVTHWVVFVMVVGGAMAAVRRAVLLVVLRYRLAAKPSDRVILVGDPHSLTGRRAAEAVLRRPGMESLGWLSERGDVDDYLGHPSAVWEVLCETGTDTVVLCGDLSREMFDSVVEAAAVAGCRVLSIRPRGPLMASQPRAVHDGRLRMLELTFPAGRAGQDVLKRLFDIIVALALLLLLAPVLALIALCIGVDSRGPVLFVQDRVGRAGRVFPMLKFRTMRDGSDEAKDELAHLNCSGDPRLFKIEKDPRVTKAGAFLRRWSLDELPQLWNVVRGDMSLVGPRPFFEADLAAYDDHHFIRLTVKPGLTGLWQVKGRSSIVDFEEVISLDREYVEKWSFFLDLQILTATIPAVLRRTGAY